MNNMRFLASPVLCTLGLISASFLATADSTIPKNIIMIVSDGMGPAYTSAYRYYADDPSTAVIENTVFDKYLVGTARTYPATVSGLVTDSAASATALAAGVKSYNGAIGVDVDKKSVESVLQRAKKDGMKTGIAVTSQIVHATPASYVAHNESRQNYNALADSYYTDRVNGNFVVDVMLGGGWANFIREDVNLVEKFTGSGYQYADSYHALERLKKGKPVLGLFADIGLPSAIDDSNPKRLSLLTEQAVKHLENDNGFFLLVEASQVDWAGHGNDIISAMAEMRDLDYTVQWLEKYVETHPDTLVVLTADHSTGGLTIGANGTYGWYPEWIHNAKMSVTTMAEQFHSEADKVAFLSNSFGFTLNEDEIKTVNAVSKEVTGRKLEAVFKDIINVRSNTGWTTSGHTGVDVEVYAMGPSADIFSGNNNNTDIAKHIFKLLADKKKAQ